MKHKKQVDIRSLLRAKGLRATPARLTVARELEQAAGPLTHAEVAKLIADGGTDQATVFRNLSDLAEVGLVRRLEIGDRLYRFEWSGSAEAKASHAHFVCVDCGEVTCLRDMQPTTVSIVARAGKRLIRDVTDVLFKGHCANCG